MSGDYQLEDTVYLAFTTRAFSTGIPTALVSGEVQIYEDASVTQITGAETLTVSLDSVAGFNMVSVAATAANGFESGKSYTAMLAAGTVDSVSAIGEVVGHFTIEMSAAALDLANGTDGLGAIKAETALIVEDTGTTLDTHLTDIKGATFSGATDSLEAIRDQGDSAWTPGDPSVASGTAQAGSANSITLAAGDTAADNLYTHLRINLTSGTGAGQSRAINGNTNSSKVATVVNSWTVNPDPTTGYSIVFDAITEIAAAPTAAENADAVWDENTAGHTGGGTFGEQVKNDIDAILADSAELQTDWADGGRLDLLLDAVLADSNELQADWANGGRLDLLLDAILVDTSEIGTGGAGLTALPWNATWDAEVQSEVNDGLVALGLDHIVAASVTGTDVVDNSIMARLVSSSATADWDDFANTTDSLQAARDKLTDIEADTSELQTDDLPTLIAAVQSDTDNIQSRLPASLNNGVMQADIQRVNDVAIVGDGSGTPFNV